MSHKIFIKVPKLMRILLVSLLLAVAIRLEFRLLLLASDARDIEDKLLSPTAGLSNDLDFFSVENLLTGRLDLFRKECDCTWAYIKNSNKCRLTPKDERYKCWKTCCYGWQIVSELAPLHRRMMQISPLPRVLVGVASSEKTYNPRILSLIQSWACKDSLPPNVKVFFFFGEDVKESVLVFFQQHGIPLESAAFLSGLVDDEYPPVRKNMAMLKWLQIHILQEEKWDWILKVDDDTLVNWPKLTDFLSKFSPHQQSLYLGSRGFGRPHERNRLGLKKPFCMGGPGYVMSMSLIRKLPENAFPECAAAYYGESRWHSDVIAGLCVYNHTRLGCWDRNADIVQMYDDSFRFFWHDYGLTDSYPPHEDAVNLYTLHPFKKPGSMISLYTKMSLFTDQMWKPKVSHNDV